MKLGFCSSAYPGRPLAEVFDKLATAGYGAVEVFTWEGHPAHPSSCGASEAAAIRRAAAERGLEISAVSAHTDWVSGGGNTSQAVDFTLRSAEVADRLGVARLITSTGPFPPACDRFAAWDALRAGMLKAADAAASLGLTLCLEPHVGHICMTWESTLKLVREIGSPNLRVNFDASHYFVLGLDYRLALEQLRDYLAYVHLKDYRLKRAPLGHLSPSPSNAEPTALGDGDFPLAEHLGHLRSIGYDGVVSAELYVPDPDSALKQSAVHVLPLLREA
ncbi:MAG: sugar phosphate isomerase/epimerase [Armatimonadetes bacterium]|nr:sugar phosphate isomerase/epimerase [Armatimonadota bacterium]